MADETSVDSNNLTSLPSETGQGISRKRVAAACDRCRRQKLKCDSERPCALCMRASVPCVSEVGGRKRIARKVRDGRLSKSHTSITLGDTNNSNGDGRSTTLPTLPVDAAQSATVPQICDQPGEDQFPTPESSTSQGHRERANGPRLKQYSQGRSAIAFSEEVFRQFSSTPLANHETGALPGGVAPPPNVNRTMTVIETIGIELPPRNVMDFLLEVYFSSVHWFMAVFHEGSFQSDYENIVSSGVTSRQHFRYLMLLLMVLSMGARYAIEQKGSYFLDTDLPLLQSKFLAKVRENMDDLLDEGEIESVQICILLSSHYLYHGRPNLAFTTLGTGVKSAQAMGLHNESTWTQLSKMAHESRRRVWLALYVFDRFASVVFGRPCSIRDDDVEVSMPEGLDGTTAVHPRFSSWETLADGHKKQVTTFSYQRYKYRLYETASPIIGDIYFHHGSSLAMIANKVQQIHDQLVAWFAGLPQELRLSSTPAESSSHDLVGCSTEVTFRLQALALQLAYDNIQILLHRPLLSQHTGHITPQDISQRLTRDVPRSHISGLCGSRTPNSPLNLSPLSKNQCWESAYRTSVLSQHENLLHKALETHAASYIGIHMFTAGTILSIVALSNPLSSRAQVSKRAIARVIRMSNLFGRRTKLCAQSERILVEFVQLILAKEMNAILPENGVRPFRRGQQQSSSTQNAAGESSAPIVDLSGTNLTSTNGDFQSSLPMGSFGSLNVTGNGALLHEQEYMLDDSEFAAFNPYDSNSFDNIDFNEGISSMRQVIHGTSVLTEGNEGGSAGYSTTNNRNISDLNFNTHPVMMQHALNGSGVAEGVAFDAFGGIKAPGQTWLWDMNSLQFDDETLL